MGLATKKGVRPMWPDPLIFLARLERFELPTYGFVVRLICCYMNLKLLFFYNESF